MKTYAGNGRVAGDSTLAAIGATWMDDSKVIETIARIGALTEQNANAIKDLRIELKTEMANVRDKIATLNTIESRLASTEEFVKGAIKIILGAFLMTLLVVIGWKALF